MVAGQCGFAAAARAQAEHRSRRAMTQKGGHWIFTGRAPPWIVGKSPIASPGAGIAFGLIAMVRIQCLGSHQRIDERARFNELRDALVTTLLYDVQRLVITDALAASRDSEQGLVRQARLKPLGQVLDGLRLVAGRLII